MSTAVTKRNNVVEFLPADQNFVFAVAFFLCLLCLPLEFKDNLRRNYPCILPFFPVSFFCYPEGLCCIQLVRSGKFRRNLFLFFQLFSFLEYFFG